MSRICVWYGTESGNAEMVADEVADAFTKVGFDPHLSEMSDLNCDDVAAADLALIITSTYGEGGLPATTEPLYDELVSTRPDLSSLKFAAFGLGDSSYENYNNAIATMTAILTELGATQIGETGRHDAQSGIDPVDIASEWATELGLTTLLAPQQ